MNVFSKIFRFVVFLWLGLAMLVPSLHGIVLCIDGHGHVAIEPASHQGCCQDHEESTGDTEDSSALSLNAITNHGCHDCIDLPLSAADISILIKNIDCRSLLKVILQYSVNDSSSVMNHIDVKATLSPPVYDYPPAPLLSLLIQDATVLRV